MFDKDFFKLQIEFAHLLAKKNNTPFEHVLFQYTSLYVRSLGFSDTKLSSQENPAWKEIIASLPPTIEEQTNYFYEKYLTYEKSKPTSNPSPFGCFAYVYHEKTNQYELHFDAIDPQGNLAKERIDVRKTELKKMFEAIKKEERQNATFFVRTWLLNIEAFTRLFPENFLKTKHLWKVSTAQDNAHWGQFLDRFGNFKTEFGEILLKKVKTENHEDINLYFPLPALIAEIEVKEIINSSA